MHNTLRYQMTEYDCGPTSLLNGISCLFPREDIPPEILRSVMLYCLDCFGPEGDCGKHGTSCTAMMFLSNWLNGFGQTRDFHISSRHLAGREVNLSQNGLVRDALRRGGVAVARVEFDGGHYVLLTGLAGEQVRLFDPYYRAQPFEDPALRMVPTARTSATASFRRRIWNGRPGTPTPLARWRSGRRSFCSTSARC